MKKSRLLAALWILVPASIFAAQKPNILYILADDMGYADAGFNGCKDIKTPNIDRIARGGTILKSFYVQPVCSPTRSTLMTGRYPSRTGVYTIVMPHAQWGLKLEEQTLAQVLRGAGYETVICGKWHLGEFEPGYRPTQRGFDHQYGLWFGNIDYFTHMREGVLDWHRDDQPSMDEGYSTNLIAKEACRIIREKNPDKPLFLYLPFNAVHSPHQVPESYCEPYQNLKGVRRTYAGMMSAMDEGVGQVLAALDQKGIRDNTLIIFSSDNGGPDPGTVTSNVPLRAGKGTIYEGGIRVCACVNWSGHIPAGKTINEPLHSVDWYPTLAKLAGASPAQKLPLDGLDIWPVLTEGAKSPHTALILCGTKRGQAAIRMGDWKLLVGAGDGDELYNLANDICETKNLAAANPDKLGELRSKYDEMMKSAVMPGGESPRGVAYATGGVGFVPNLYNRALLPMTPFIYYDNKLVTYKTWPDAPVKIDGVKPDLSKAGLLDEYRKKMFEADQGANFGTELSVLANCWKTKFGGEDPQFFYTIPSKTLAPRVAPPQGIKGASTACEIDHWLNHEQVTGLIDTVVTKAYK